VIRPANLSVHSPGRGLAVVPAADGTPVAVLNLQGLLFMTTPVGPFEVVDALVEEAREQAQVVVVDFHAEATSEKVALARVLDGRVTAVFGTHTHVQTRDARVQPGGTAAASQPTRAAETSGTSGTPGRAPAASSEREAEPVGSAHRGNHH